MWKNLRKSEQIVRRRCQSTESRCSIDAAANIHAPMSYELLKSSWYSVALLEDLILREALRINPCPGCELLIMVVDV